MKKPILIVSIVIILIVLVGAYFLLQKPTVNCDMKKSESEKFSCQVSVAVDEKDIAICEKIADLAYKSDCVSKVSAALKKCDDLKVMDKAFCYQVRATNEKDVALCDKARDSTWAGSESVVYSCYTDVAKITKDTSVCEQLCTIEQNGPYKSDKYCNVCYGLIEN